MRRISASKLDIAVNCLAPWTSNLPWETAVSPQARYGTELHEMIEDHFRGRQPKVITSKHKADFDTWQQWAQSEDSLNLKSGLPEVKYAFDGESVIVLPDNGTRNYNDAPELSIVGTADLVTDTAVIDWKTGARVEHPTNSAQIKFLAAVSNKEWGAVVQIRNGAVVSKRAHYTQTQHALVKGQAKHLLQMVQEKTKYNAGEHCKWCPVRHRCPELRGNTGEFDFLE